MSVSRTRRSALLGGLLAVVTACSVVALAPQASAAQSRHPLPGSTPKWLGNAHRVAATPDNKKISFGLLLGLRNADKIDSQIQALTDPSSASYGQWLTNAQFKTRYAPAASDVAAVEGWLAGQGFTVGRTLPSGLFVPASGTAAQIEKTFGTNLNSYSLDGKTVLGNSSALSLPSGTPAAVVGAVGGVLGLDQGTALKKPADTEPPVAPSDGRFGVQPCSSYFGQKTATTLPSANGKKQPYAVCGYTPKQVESAYGLSNSIARGVDGRGITVAVTDAYASPTIVGDVAKYNHLYGLPQFKPGQFSQIIPADDGYANVDECGAAGWYGEQTLDIEAVHAMAPGAKVVYVGGSDCINGLDEAWATTIDNHVADVITDSWTDYFDDPSLLGQDYIDYYDTFSKEAALTGISVLFSTGDSGDHTNEPCTVTGLPDGAYCARSAEFPSDSPYVTAVGGTSLEIGSRGQWLGEYGWQDAYATLGTKTWNASAWASGGGGGTSQIWKEPFYQKGVVPNSVARSNGGQPMRSVPDVAMIGDPNTGLRVGQTQVFPDGTYWDTYRIGGTSLASPLMAGVLAVAGSAAHHAIGFANPLLYSLNRTSAVHDLVAPRTAAHQVRTDYANGFDASGGLTYKLETIDVQSTTLHDVRGWDNETGVGSPNGSALLAAVSRGHRGR